MNSRLNTILSRVMVVAFIGSVIGAIAISVLNAQYLELAKSVFSASFITMMVARIVQIKYQIFVELKSRSETRTYDLTKNLKASRMVAENDLV